MIKGAFEDKFLKEELHKIIQKYDINTIIETGSYKGWSTNVLAQYGKEVISIEINPELLNLAKANNSHNSNVIFYEGSSQKILEKILPDYKNKNLVIFLDAHWHDYWPILDELTVIKDNELEPVIIIHDFFTPNEFGNSKFGFDRYKDQNLDFYYVKKHIEEIYKNGYNHYCMQESELNVGVGIFCPKSR